MTKDSLERNRSCWRRENDRPLLGINVGMFANQWYPRAMREIPNGPVRPEDIRTDLFLEDVEQLFQIHQEAGGDSPFVASALVHIPWMEAIMGCPVMASPETFWSEPIVEDWDSWSEPRLDSDNPWFEKLIELTRALVERFGDNHPVSHTLMRGPGDILSGLRGAGQLPLDLMLKPDRLRAVAESIADIWIEVCRTQLDLIPKSPEGYHGGGNGLRCWAPDKVAWLQEDATALLSPNVYRSTLEEVDRRILSAFDATAFHLHDSARWMIDHLTEFPELDVIEFNQDLPGAHDEDWFNLCRKVQERKLLVIWRGYDDTFGEWMENLLKRISPRGVWIVTTVMTLEDAKRVNDRFLEITGEQ